MAASYKKLFKLLIDRDMKKKELAEKAGISIATITKMGKDGAVVSSDVLVKICSALGCTMDDIMISMVKMIIVLCWRCLTSATKTKYMVLVRERSMLLLQTQFCRLFAVGYADESANLVGVTGLEPAASKSQTSRATNCATPRFLFDFLLILRRSGTNCGQTRFLRFFEFLQSAENPHKKSDFFSVCKGFGGFAFRRGAPFLPAGAPRLFTLPKAFELLVSTAFASFLMLSNYFKTLS